ncbi:MAG: hypothetical protein COB42_07965 [Sulfurimonas sp.]|nr:MAG: hypothetical protein COB42_07965 [Sulfurimonas sp.]
MQIELKEHLAKVVELVNNILVNPDINIDYFLPEESVGDPYILLKFITHGGHLEEQKIPIKRNYLKKTPQDLANLITFFVEQFIEQMDSLEHGAQ